MKSELTRKRVWELDAFRGFCLLCMFIDHSLNIFKYFGGFDIVRIPFFWFIKHYFGALFVVISGICVYFSHSSFRRGLIVFACGMSLTAATYWLYLSGREDDIVLIRWGVLHMIGFCMIVYPVFKKLPDRIKLLLGAAIVIAGYYLALNVRVHNPWLFPLGLKTIHFRDWDIFAILPHLGWFLIGNALGSVLYHKTPKTLLPSVNTDLLPIRFFCWLGRNSLVFYMIHLPVLYCLAKCFHV